MGVPTGKVAPPSFSTEYKGKISTQKKDQHAKALSMNPSQRLGLRKGSDRAMELKQGGERGVNLLPMSHMFDS